MNPDMEESVAMKFWTAMGEHKKSIKKLEDAAHAMQNYYEQIKIEKELREQLSKEKSK